MADIIVFNVKTENVSQDTYEHIAPTLDDLKAARMLYLKDELAPGIVYLNAPLYKQQSAALGLYSVEEETAIKKWISSVRSSVAEVEDTINKCTSQDGLEQVVFDYDSVLNRATEINAL